MHKWSSHFIEVGLQGWWNRLPISSESLYKLCFAKKIIIISKEKIIMPIKFRFIALQSEKFIKFTNKIFKDYCNKKYLEFILFFIFFNRKDRRRFLSWFTVNQCTMWVQPECNVKKKWNKRDINAFETKLIRSIPTFRTRKQVRSSILIFDMFIYARVYLVWKTLLLFKCNATFSIKFVGDTSIRLTVCTFRLKLFEIKV